MRTTVRVSSKEAYKAYCEKRKLIETVPTHVGPQFNKMLCGGLKTQQFYVLLASTGVGKSTTMMQFALDCYRAGKNAAYVTIDEQNEFEILERMACMWFEISYYEYIENPEEHPEVEDFIMNKLMERITVYFTKNPFEEFVIERDKKKYRLTDFDQMIFDMQDRGIKFVFVDYLNAVAIDKDAYSKLTQISSGLKDIAEEYNFMIFTAMQTNRDLKKAMKQMDFDATLVDESYMADSIGPARKATVCLSLVKQKDSSYKTLNVFKNRLNGTLLGSVTVESDGLSMKLSEVYDPKLGF